MMAMSRASTRRGLFGLAMTKVSNGPSTISMPAIINTIVVAPVRYHPGQRYQPKYSVPSANRNKHVLAVTCSPNALNLNFMRSYATAAWRIFSSNRHLGVYVHGHIPGIGPAPAG